MIHIFDNFLPRGIALAAASEWPDSNWPHWHLYHDQHANKFATKDVDRLPPACRMAFNRLCELHVAALHSSLRDSFPDMLAHGAGLHWMQQGGMLDWHRDAASHPSEGWSRTLSASVYLSENLAGGELVVKTSQGTQTVRPKFNQLIAFSPGDLHCVNPVESEDRKSVACFFWDATPSSGPFRSEFVHGDTDS